jgi:hypothetical protein
MSKGDPTSGKQILSDLLALSQRAAEADHYESMTKGLLKQNQSLQESLSRLTSMLGNYIEAHGPLVVDFRAEGNYEIFTEPTTDKLGHVSINACPVPTKPKIGVRATDPLIGLKA